MQHNNFVIDEEINTGSTENSLLINSEPFALIRFAKNSVFNFFSATGCNVEKTKPASKKSLCPNLPSIFAESVTGLGFAAATTPFFERGTSWKHYAFHPFTVASAVLTYNLYSRLIRDFAKTQTMEGQNLSASSRAMLFGFLYGITFGSLMHEVGHLGMGSLLYNAKPQLTILPFGGGYVNFSDWNGMTKLGESLGENKSSVLVSAAGPGTELLLSYIALLAAQCIPNPEIKIYLRLCVLISIIHNLYYAISPLINCDVSGNDFCNIDDKTGISPFLPVTVIVGSSMLIQIFLSAISTCFSEKNTNDAAQIQELDCEIQDVDDNNRRTSLPG